MDLKNVSVTQEEFGGIPGEPQLFSTSMAAFQVASYCLEENGWPRREWESPEQHYDAFWGMLKDDEDPDNLRANTLDEDYTVRVWPAIEVDADK